MCRVDGRIGYFSCILTAIDRQGLLLQLLCYFRAYSWVIHRSLGLKYGPFSEPLRNSPSTHSPRYSNSMKITRAQWKLLQTWIKIGIVKQYLIQIYRVDGPIEYLSCIITAMRSQALPPPAGGPRRRLPRKAQGTRTQWILLGTQWKLLGLNENYSGSMKITTHLDHISDCKTSSGTNVSSIWTYWVFIMHTHRNWSPRSSSSTYVLLSSLQLSDTQVFEP